MQDRTVRSILFDRYLVVILALISTGVICFLKIKSLHSWQYSTDIFIYDAFLKEIVFNQRFVEFTYGNQFGDHAYLYLLILYPAKLILKSNFIYLLLIFNPTLFFISTISLYRIFLSRTTLCVAFIGTLSYLAGFGILYQGLLEGIYGFHPDLGTGFLLISITCILIQQSTKTKKWTDEVLLILAILIFLSIKEEMALLGLIFFSIIFFTKKEKRMGWFALLSLVIIVFDFLLIKNSQTQFNRSNVSLVMNLWQGLGEEGLKYLFINPRGPQILVIQYWIFLIATLLFFHLWWIFRKKINPYLIGLFYTGIVKLGLNLILRDFRLTSWHGLPGAFMVIAALLLVITLSLNEQPKKLRNMMVVILLFGSYLFITQDAPYLVQRIRDYRLRESRANNYSKQLRNLSTLIPKDRIVSIPMFSPIAMIDQRISFYPNGIHFSPVGIADFAIIPENVSHMFTGNYENLYPIEEYQDHFQLVTRTKNFLLYQRMSLNQGDLEARSDFFTSMGLSELIPLP